MLRRIVNRVRDSAQALSEATGFVRVEQTAWRLLRERMEQMAPAETHGAPAPSRPRAPRSESARETLRRLLEQAENQDEPQARAALYARIAGELVPDEVRVLAALAEGTHYPLVHLVATGPLRGTRRVLENLSNVGKLTGVALPPRAGLYIRHLRELELAETGAEEEEFKQQYELLEAEEKARATAARIRQEPGSRARFVRRVLRISDFGREFWQACQGYDN